MSSVSSKKPQEEVFDQFLSFEDLKGWKNWDEVWKSMDISKVEELLYEAGVDLNYGWTIAVVNHRPRTSNKPFYGPRFQFKSRLDKEWVGKGMLSIEDIIENCTDPQLRTEMIMISRRSKNTEEACAHAKANSPEDILEEKVKENTK